MVFFEVDRAEFHEQLYGIAASRCFRLRHLMRFSTRAPQPDACAGIRPPDVPDPQLGAVIQYMRTGRGITRAQLARQAKVDESELVAIEAGVADPVWSTLERIASALDTSPPELARLADAQRRG